MFAGGCTVLVMFGVPETYRESLLLQAGPVSSLTSIAPKILAQKAKRLRKETGDERWYAPRKWPGRVE